jgi:tRNA-splicing ligase RtcB
MQTCDALEIEIPPGACPVRCFCDEDLLPDEAARERLGVLAAIPGLAEYISVLPDVHYKPSNPTPTGTVVVTKDVLIPRAIDTGTNCGMRAICSGVPAREFTPRILDELFGHSLRQIPLKSHDEPLFGATACEEMLVHGLDRLRDALELTSQDIARTENRGRFLSHLDPEEIRGVLPRSAVRKGVGGVGTVGAGNHFLELQRVAEVLDRRAADALGVRLGDAVFMLHSDSRRLGKKILKPLRDEAERDGRLDGPQGELWTVPAESEYGRRYLAALAAASHAGFANRAAVTYLLRRAVRDALGDRSLDLPLIFDCGHETIQREEHNGQAYWVHRHGTSHTVPAEHWPHDPVLSAIGQPVPLPGCMGSDSYLAVAGAGVAQTFHSVAHGAGRVIEKIDAAETFDEARIEAEMQSLGIRLYRYGVDNIAGQAPASFKNVNRVVAAMASWDLITPVARLRPMAVLKG